MEGHLCRKCVSVDSFVKILGDKYLIRAMVFNHGIKLLSTINIGDPLFQVIQPKMLSRAYVLVSSQ